jgi:hypothetical protein
VQVAREPDRPPRGHGRDRRTRQTTPLAAPSATTRPAGSHHGSPRSDACALSECTIFSGAATAADVVVAGVAGTLADDDDAAAVASGDAEAGPVVAADAVGEGVGAAGLVAAVAGFGAAFAVTLVVAFAVGCLVGVDVVAAGAGAAGAVPGGSASPPFCHEKATVAPAGTVSEPAATLAYFQPEVPSDQYSPQYASAGEVFTHGSLAGAPSTRQTNPACRCA